jgi:hypothetical protein
MVIESISQQFLNQVFEYFRIAWCFSCTWALIALCTWSLWSALRSGFKQIRQLHRVPCNRCAFCTGDYRLKCTVHPMNALSEEAINCPDFQVASDFVNVPRSVIQPILPTQVHPSQIIIN